MVSLFVEATINGSPLKMDLQWCYLNSRLTFWNTCPAGPSISDARSRFAARAKEAMRNTITNIIFAAREALRRITSRLVFIILHSTKSPNLSANPRAEPTTSGRSCSLTDLCRN